MLMNKDPLSIQVNIKDELVTIIRRFIQFQIIDRKLHILVIYPEISFQDINCFYERVKPDLYGQLFEFFNNQKLMDKRGIRKDLFLLFSIICEYDQRIQIFELFHQFKTGLQNKNKRLKKEIIQKRFISAAYEM